MHPDHDAKQAGAVAERIAVIAIHGVADQKQGDTARSVAALLAGAGGDQASYSEGEVDSITLRVETIPPVTSRKLEDDNLYSTFVSLHNGASTVVQTQVSAVGPVEKAVRQSLRSDFQRTGWHTSNMHKLAADPVAQVNGPALAMQDGRKEEDLGLAFSEYLLFKADRNGAQAESYEAVRIRSRRTEAADQSVRQVDVHEMYWADLSRMSGAVPRLVAELFTMVFRLSRLGRDAIDQSAKMRQAAKAPSAKTWEWLSSVQIALDWAFVALLTNFFLQLLFIGLVVAGLGLAAPYAQKLQLGIAWVLPAMLAWWMLYLAPNSAARATAVITAFALGVMLWVLPAHLVLGVAWVGALALAIDAGLKFAEMRFPATLATGRFFLAGTILALLAHVLVEAFPISGQATLAIWIFAGMRLVEYLLLLVVVWWAVAPLLLAAWLVLGQRAARKDPEARGSVGTGRVGLFASIASFTMITMVIWAMLTSLIQSGAAGTPYDPIFFSVDTSKVTLDGADFFKQRYTKSTEAFSLVAGLLLLLFAYLIVILVPSVFAEIKAAIGTPRNLGRWLSGGLNGLENFITVVAIASVLIATTIGGLMLLARFDANPAPWLGEFAVTVAAVSEHILKPMVFSAAGILAFLTAFGGFLSRYVPWLRLPLDAALDVDNHFREFPRKTIPRAQIFSRYVALLEHIAAQRYDRVVIVAHSQGTVISAELLRYLKHRAGEQGKAGVQDRVTRLWDALGGKIDIVTAGCPLRQLYAARFPDLYPWVLAVHDGRSGPLAADIGVGRWINIYTTGDYVGRWLWCDPAPAFGTVKGVPSVYNEGSFPGLGATGEADVCLGSGAHTHYFEMHQKVVAQCIDYLVAGRQLQASAEVGRLEQGQAAA